jgi:hypothetical protein
MAESFQEITEQLIGNGSPSDMANTVVTPSSETHVSILDDQTILLNLDTGSSHTLDPAGTIIWELFTSNRTLAQVQASLCTRYGIPEDVAREDLWELVHRLNHEGFVKISKP